MLSAITLVRSTDQVRAERSLNWSRELRPTAAARSTRCRAKERMAADEIHLVLSKFDRKGVSTQGVQERRTVSWPRQFHVGVPDSGTTTFPLRLASNPE